LVADRFRPGGRIFRFRLATIRRQSQRPTRQPGLLLGIGHWASSEELTMDSNSATTAREPRIIIVGGGFGGIAATQALRKSSARLLLIDKPNHHVYQTFLYQVATSVLSPENIAAPIRHVLHRQANTTVVQDTVTGVDVGKKLCFVDGAPLPLPYDYLVLAT